MYNGNPTIAQGYPQAHGPDSAVTQGKRGTPQGNMYFYLYGGGKPYLRRSNRSLNDHPPDGGVHLANLAISHDCEGEFCEF